MSKLAKIIDHTCNALIKWNAPDEWLRYLSLLRFHKLRKYYQSNKKYSNLIVSLTSFPPRFSTLEYTIKSLLSQSTPPTRVVLWIYSKDMHHLPKQVIDIQCTEFEIRSVDTDYRSYKKVYPAAIEFEKYDIVTADDDLFYNATWLSELLQHFNKNEKKILAHRAHRVTTDENGDARPYRKWKWRIKSKTPVSGRDIFITGGAGALYPSGSLNSPMMTPDRFMDECESADDIWLYFLTVQNGYLPTIVPSTQREYAWNGSQEVALKHENLDRHMNDIYLSNLTTRYGKPWKSINHKSDQK